MIRQHSLLIVILSLAFVILVAPDNGRAQNLPDGVSIEVIAEYPSKTNGVEKILFRSMVLQPGATWSFTVPAQSLCHATRGELEVVDHTSGETLTFEVGDRWDTSPGHEVTLTNRGTVEHEHLFYTMIAAK